MADGKLAGGPENGMGMHIVYSQALVLKVQHRDMLSVEPDMASGHGWHLFSKVWKQF